MKAEERKNEIEKDTVVKGLSHLLADTYTLTLKTQNFHWNVTGPNFYQLHLLFESQYKDMNKAVDEIAERIRALGCKAPGSFKEFKDLSSIEEEGTNKLSTTDMITSLIEANHNISKKAHEISFVARKNDDEVSSGIMTERIKFHEKAIWMLRSVRE